MTDETIVETPEVSEEVTESIDDQVAEAIEEANEENQEPSENEEVNEESSEEPETIEEAKQLIKSLKLKVNGKELEEELPFEIDPEHAEYLQRKFQMAAAGQEAMRTKAEIEKKYESELNGLKENPWEVLEKLGLDPDELAEMRIQQRIEEMQKSPEELEKEALSREVEELRQRIKAEEESKKEAEYQKIQKQFEQELSSQIEKAIESNTSLPKTAYVTRKMADAMLWAYDNGYNDVKASDIAPIVEKEIRQEYQQMVDSMPDQILESFIGKKSTERLRKQRLQKAAKAPEPKVQEVAKPKTEEDKPARKLSMHDFLNTPLSELKDD